MLHIFIYSIHVKYITQFANVSESKKVARILYFQFQKSSDIDYVLLIEM